MISLRGILAPASPPVARVMRSSMTVPSEIAGTAVQGHLGALRAQHDPIRLDVRDVVQHQTREGVGQKVEPSGGRGEMVAPGVGRVKRQAG